MKIKVFVFDFDGTLVESNMLKYEAFFELFPQDGVHKHIIGDVLAQHLEESRYVILEHILKKLGNSSADLGTEVNALAARYNDLVVAGAKTCPACPGAEDVLQRACQRHAVYISSTTPECALRDVLAFRQWERYLTEIFGYPRKKVDTLQEIIQREAVTPEQILVVGDGESDRASAQKTGCCFFDVNTSPLTELDLEGAYTRSYRLRAS